MKQEILAVGQADLNQINSYLCSPDNEILSALWRVMEKYGTPAEINAKAAEAGRVENLMARLKNMDSPFYEDLLWLISARDKGAFVSISDFRKKVLGDGYSGPRFKESTAVTLEISPVQYFPWLIDECKTAIDRQDLMGSRYVRFRYMPEQVADRGDLLAMIAAAKIMGASFVDVLDSKGSDGSNIHLCGPSTITGYLGGVGMPNDYGLLYIDEFLHYYTQYGLQEVLNVNSGTVLLASLLYRMGVDIKFKISVLMGNDNPYSILSTLIQARMLARPDGSVPLSGFNIANSIDLENLRLIAEIRRQLGLENQVRIEHHITETFRGIVKQPYLRRDELADLAETVPNVSAKHEGGDPDDEATLAYSSDIADHFRTTAMIDQAGDRENIWNAYRIKHTALNRTAEELTRRRLSFIAAQNLHRR